MSVNQYEDFKETSSLRSFVQDNIYVNTSIENILDKIMNNEDIILYGPPGTGKSYLMKQVQEHLKDINKLGHVKTIQFHTEYTYDDFIEGLKPVNNGFEFELGELSLFCDEVNKRNDLEKVNILFLDEINRTDITATFGELMYLIEEKGDRSLKLSKTNFELVLPKNLVIIGTMNTSDKSLSKLDFALRRRFKFLPVNPSSEFLKTILLQKKWSIEETITLEEYITAFEKLNQKIRESEVLGKELMLGHALFVPNKDDISENDIFDLYRELIFPQLESYCFGNPETLSELLGESLKSAILLGYTIPNSRIIEHIKLLQTYAD